MSADSLRRSLESKRKQRVDAEKKAGDAQAKESKKRSDAASARSAASRTKSATTAKSKLQQAERDDRAAASAGTDASRWLTKAAGYRREEAALATRLTKAEQDEAAAAERQRSRDAQRDAQRRAADHAALSARIQETESAVHEVRRHLPEPKPEKLRILLLGAGADGSLRIGREQSRIRAAVQSATGRDLVDLDPRGSATTDDLLDGIARFRPHIVHFSGHSNTDLIVFEDDVDEPHQGVIVSARAFARAIAATDDPPLLVLLNSCSSAGQIDALVEQVVPFAIGMADTIFDADAITYAARFYASLAEGQSIKASHDLGVAALDLAGLPGAELPTLASAPDVDARSAVLVRVTAS